MSTMRRSASWDATAADPEAQRLHDAAAQARQGDAEALRACIEAVEAWWADAERGAGPYAQPGAALGAALGAAAEAWRAQQPGDCARAAAGSYRAGALAALGEAWVAGALQEAAARARQGDAAAIEACATAVCSWWADAARGAGPYAQPGPALGAALGEAAEAWRAQEPGMCSWWAAVGRRTAALAALGEAWVAGALQEAAARARQGDAAAIEACVDAVAAWWVDAGCGEGPYAQPGPVLCAALGHALAPAATGGERSPHLSFRGLPRAVARDAAAAALREAFGAPRPDVARWEARCRTGGGHVCWALLARATADDDRPAALAALAKRLQQRATRLRGQPLARWIAGRTDCARALRRLYGDAAWASALLEQAIAARDADAMDAAQRLARRAPAASEAS